MKWILVLAAVAAITSTPTGAQPATVTVHADRPGPTYDRRIFGQFAEHLGAGIYGGIWVGKDSAIPNDAGYRKDVIAALKELRVPFVRWPGGCFADEYHWRDGVGPKRRTGINASWGGVPEPNSFGTDEFYGFIERIGADAYIAGNVGSAAPNELADWLGYITAKPGTSLGDERAANGHRDPWKVAIVGIGNELWGCGGNMRPEYAADETARYATFARSANGSMLKIAVGPSEGDTNWTDVMMRQAGRTVDGLSLHYYTVPGGWERKSSATNFGEREWAETLSLTLRMDKLIADHSAVMDKYDPKRTKILAVDEWGSWYADTKGAPTLRQKNSLRDAVLAAANLNIFAKHAERVKISAIAQMVNVLQAMLLTDGPRMVRTPTYWTYWLYRPWQDATVLPVEIAGPTYASNGFSMPSISASAVRGKDGLVHFALANLDPNRAVPMSIPGISGRSISGQILTARRIDAHNDFDAPNVVAPAPFNDARLSSHGVRLTLPAKSVVVLTIR